MNETNESQNRLDDLPETRNEYWEGAETSLNRPKPIELCSSHSKDNWTEHRGYKDNHDGTISCKFCPWGTPLAGWYRVHEERIVDLRTL